VTQKNLKAGKYLVIGASGTIGSAVVHRLAEHADTVGLHYCSNHSALEKLHSSLENSGVYLSDFQSHLDSEAACTEVFEEAYSELGSLEGIALCAGRVPWQSWQEISVTDWQSTLFEHCIAPFILAKLAVLRMQEQGSGRIVFLSSIAAKYGGSPLSLHYAAAKGALEVAMHGLSRNVAKSGLCVNGIRSGFVNSPQQQSGRSSAEISERIKKIPMNRAGKAEEIAAAVNFLLSSEASYITGELITVSGGD
jgi:NAD(P)-dependent dehydrogenase (short-subunit alcohol dehydrogenase family)